MNAKSFRFQIIPNVCRHFMFDVFLHFINYQVDERNKNIVEFLLLHNKLPLAA